jgi:hypothetical protein
VVGFSLHTKTLTEDSLLRPQAPRRAGGDARLRVPSRVYSNRDVALRIAHLTCALLSVGDLLCLPLEPDLTLPTAARDARRLSTLLEVSQALSGTLNLKSSMQRVLQTLIRHHSVVRGMVTLLRDGELHVEAVEGFEDRARRSASSSGKASPGRSSRAASRLRAARQP